MPQDVAFGLTLAFQGPVPTHPVGNQSDRHLQEVPMSLLATCPVLGSVSWGR